MPSNAGTIPVISNILKPRKTKNNEIPKANPAEIAPDGMGRFDVLLIRASKSFSWYWLIPDEPPASNKTPIKTHKAFNPCEWSNNKYPIKADTVTINDNLNFMSVNMTFKLFIYSSEMLFRYSIMSLISSSLTTSV